MMSPFKSSLAKSAKQLLVFTEMTDLVLRGATQTSIYFSTSFIQMED